MTHRGSRCHRGEAGLRFILFHGVGHADCLLPLFEWQGLVHLAERCGSALQTGIARAFHEGIGAHGITRDAFAVIKFGGEHILRARFAAFGGALQPWHRVSLAIEFIEDEAEVVLCLEVALCGGAAEPFGCLRQILLHTAAEFIGLPQIKLRIGIAIYCERTPFVYRAGVVAGFPCGDASAHVCVGRCGERATKGGEGHSGDYAGE